MTPNNKIPKKKLDTYRTFLDIRLPQTHGILVGLDDSRWSFLSHIIIVTIVITIIATIAFISENREPNIDNLLQEQRDRIHSEIYK